MDEKPSSDEKPKSSAAADSGALTGSGTAMGANAGVSGGASANVEELAPGMGLPECDDCMSRNLLLMYQIYAFADDLQEIVQKTSDAIGGPIMVLDCEYKLLASHNCGNMADEAWLDSEQLGYMSNMKLEREIDAHRPAVYHGDSRATFVWDDPSNKYPRMVDYLSFGGELLGYLVILATKGMPDETSMPYRRTFSMLLAKYLFKDTGATRRGVLPYEGMFISLLEDDFTDRAVLENRAIGAGFASTRGSFFLLSIGVEKDGGAVNSSMRALFPMERTFYYKHQVMVMLSRDAMAKGVLSEREQRVLLEVLESRDLLACMSDEFDDLGMLKAAYLHNKDVLEMGQIFHKGAVEGADDAKTQLDGRIFYYDDLRYLATIYHEAIQERPVNLLNYVRKDVLRLYYSDIENNTELLKTMLMFLVCRESFVHTAENLFVHKNTVVYRIGKIKSDFGIEMEDSREIGDILLSCSIIQLHERMQRIASAEAESAAEADQSAPEGVSAAHGGAGAAKQAAKV